MDNQEKQLDQELAAFTDSLLEGQPMTGPARPSLADTVEMLARTTKPQTLPASLRSKVKQRISTEWDRQHLPLHQRLSSLVPSGRGRRWIPVSVVILALLAIAALIIPLDTMPTPGTALGDTAVLPIMLLALAAILVGIWLVIRHR